MNNDKLSRCIYCSPLGDMLAVADDRALLQLKFCDYDLSPVEDKSEIISQVFRWLDIYFSGREPDFMPPIRPSGTCFRNAVWRRVMDIPYGHTATYGEIARSLGTSARAVGGAVAHNPITLIVPCHRIIGVGGEIGGYAWGINRKRSLLLQEEAT